MVQVKKVGYKENLPKLNRTFTPYGGAGSKNY